MVDARAQSGIARVLLLVIALGAPIDVLACAGMASGSDMHSMASMGSDDAPHLADTETMTHSSGTACGAWCCSATCGSAVILDALLFPAFLPANAPEPILIVGGPHQAFRLGILRPPRS